MQITKAKTTGNIALFDNFTTIHFMEYSVSDLTGSHLSMVNSTSLIDNKKNE